MTSPNNTSCRIELLNRSNYDTWSIQAQAVLIRSGLWKCITGEKGKDEDDTNQEKQLLARSELFLLISPSELRQVKNCKTASEIWETLKNAYESKGPARKATLLKQLILKRMKEKEDVRDFMNSIFEIIDKLESMEVNINADLLSIMLLYSLPSSFENFRIAIESRDKLPTPEELKIKIIEESEARRNINGTKTTQSTQEDEAYYGKKAGKKIITCNICHKRGHMSKNCWENKHKNNKEKPKSCNVSLAIKTGKLNSSWCLDSGSTSHMTGEKERFSEIEYEDLGTLRFASDQYKAEIKGSGKVKIEEENVTLHNTLYVPGLTQNLMSVPRVTEYGHTVLFTKNKAYVKDKDNKTFLEAEKINGLYYLKLDEQANCIQEKENDMMKWHKKLAHLNENDLKNMLTNNLAKALKFNKNDNVKSCETCIKGKMHCLPFQEHAGTKANDLLEIIYSDVCGPMQTKSPADSQYFITFIDEYSKYCFVYFMKNKSEAFDKFLEFKEEVENITNKRIKYFHTDNGTEYVNEKFNTYLKKNGIRRRLTTVYTPQQNGIAERKNRTLLDKARCMMIGSNVPEKLWAEAVTTANYLVNRCPTKSLKGETPYMKWVGRTPSVKHLHVFGAKAFILHKGKRRGKFQPKAQEGVFVGYAQNRKAYRIFLPRKNMVVESRDVKVLDEVMYYQKRSDVQEDEILVPSPETKGNESNEKGYRDITITNNKTLNHFQPSPQHSQEKDSDDSSDEMHSFHDDDENDDEDRRSPEMEYQSPVRQEQSQDENNRPKRQTKPPVWSKDYEMEENFEDTYLCESDDDIHDEEWHEAIKAEIKAHIKNGTWKIISKEENTKNLVDYKMILKEKIGLNNEVTKKARLVAKGFTQKPGIDYDETYAPVAKLSSIRLLLALAVEQNLKLDQLDVTTAYLNGNLDEKIIMKKPVYLEKYVQDIMLDESENENHDLFNKARTMLQDLRKGKNEKVCLLKKALYGLKQSGRQWYKKLDQELRKMDFKPLQADPCVYVYDKGGDKVITTIYVDDIIMAYSNDKTMKEIKRKLKQSFEIKDLGKLSYCLGLEITRENDELILTQRKYIEKVLKKYNMQDCKPVSTPIEPYLKLQKADKCDPNIPYQSLIGTLMYLAVASRPDLAYAVSYLSQFNNCYSEEHFKYAKRILRYLKGTKDIGINYKRTGKELYGLADADWAGCTIDRKSYSGYVFKYANACVSWEARKQKCTALSTAEAEYIALAEAAKEAIHLKALANELGINQDAVLIYSDNQAAQGLCKNPVISGKSKHIDIKYHFIRECVQKGMIRIYYMETSRMEADILTKGVPAPRLRELRTQLGLK